MPSQLHMLFGCGPPRMFAGRARNGRALVKATPSQNPFSFYAGSIVRSGDYVTVEKVSFPGGYQVVMGADGVIRIVANSDVTRQLVHAELYSRRLQMWTGDSNQFVNNHAPIGQLLSLELVIGITPPPLVLPSLFTDADGDGVQPGSISGDLWPGASRLGGQIIGSPTDIGTGSFQVLGSDIAEAIGTAQVNWTVLAAPPPPPAAGGLTEHIRVKTAIGGSLTGN